MLDHWDNVDVHPVMGQVERGYAGGSIFWQDGALRGDLSRVRAYGRLLAACGVNAVAVNNVNVHATEAHLLTDRLGDVSAIADLLRPHGIRVTCRSTSPRPSPSAGCRPPTRSTRMSATGGRRPPSGCTRRSPISAATW
jgi:alpha-glucuronidase